MAPRVWISACLAMLSQAMACSSSEVSSSHATAGHSSLGGSSATPAGVAGTGGSSAGGVQDGPDTPGGTGPLAGAASLGGASGSAAGGPQGGATLGGAAGAVATTAGAGGTAPRPFKGVANAACTDLGTGRLNASWWYNWTTSPSSCKQGEFVPMISGKNEKTPEAVASALQGIKAAGYRTVLGFNEPNKADQSNLAVADVVKLWPSLTADPDVRVSSPATSADAKAWFEDFMTQVDAQSLRVDFVAIHWYGWNAGSCNDAKELESYLTWTEKFKRPIWITELGCMNASNPSADVVQKFYAGVLEMLQKHGSVERYAWYPWNTNNELVLSGDLTALGTAFGQAPAMR